MSKVHAKYHVMNQANADYQPSLVSIDYDAIKNLNFLIDFKEALSPHENEALKGKDLNESIRFLLALNSINYQYWDLHGDEFVRYHHNKAVGALACYDGFVHLWEELQKNATLYDRLNEDVMTQYFGDIPEKASRIEILKESLNPATLSRAALLVEKHLRQGLIDTQTAADVAEVLPKSFKEPYLKKVQLALYEIHLHAKSFAVYSKESLTVAADYQLPKVLEAMGVIQYSDGLKEKISNYKPIEVDSAEERAIRAATILSCEEISAQKNVSIPAIDRWLWLARNNFKDKKFHLTKTTAY